jgi:ubiquinone/menaquinone biosynthesis C-methylase UbiE
MNLAAQRRDWDELAELDPYWAVCTTPGRRFGGWDADEFFATGEREAAAVLDAAGALGVPSRHRAALDFGCGLGRLTRPLSRRFDRAVGVDISPRMVARARELTPSCEFAVNSGADLPGLEDAAFDLVLSSIVLQHVPRREWIEAYLREFVRVLAPGGAIVFTLPSHIPLVFRAQWRRHLYHALRRAGGSAETVYRRLRLQPIAMSHLDEPRVTATLEAAGARVLRADTWAAAGLLNRGVRSTRYFATR